MRNKIEVEEKLRPCYVLNDRKSDKKNALFHMWVEWKGLSIDILDSNIRALVEYETGQVDLVEPRRIIFIDSNEKFKEYVWDDFTDNTYGKEGLINE